MSAGPFGASLRRGRSPRLRTVDNVLAVMGEPPAGPAFLDEVEAFLAVTGIKRSLLGQGATGNPSFVTQLVRGVSPTLATVGAMRDWMFAHASAGEWRGIRAWTGAMSCFMTGALLPPPEPLGRSGANGPREERPTGRRKGRKYVNTCETAKRLRLSPRTLDTCWWRQSAAQATARQVLSFPETGCRARHRKYRDAGKAPRALFGSLAGPGIRPDRIIRKAGPAG